MDQHINFKLVEDMKKVEIVEEDETRPRPTTVRDGLGNEYPLLP